MTEQPITSTEELEPLPLPSQDKPLHNFLLGVFFGLIPVWVGLDMSSYMTHTPWLEYGVWKLAIAASIPLATGALGVVLKGKFLKALGDVMSSTVM